MTVPYPTASISLSDPFQDYAAGSAPLQLELDDRNIVTSYRSLPASDHSLQSPQGEEEEEEVVEREEEGDVQVVVTVKRSPKSGGRRAAGEVGEMGVMPKRPALPPFFYLKPPFTYVS